MQHNNLDAVMNLLKSKIEEVLQLEGEPQFQQRHPPYFWE